MVENAENFYRLHLGGFNGMEADSLIIIVIKLIRELQLS